ncbi:DUF3754 domain-containing protein [Phycicoccus sp. BSK3Z-2]|uniref:DUF3754 domain-containing protein n=1 Tax=Phycicoccus avicenniae TaxID=2828860 RepID=A0A941I024_9MICO|nr:DUF3754 domain-containing protein [Phycicoccus avicenniae]MBR7742744.1 DUF3754 domain-containing protein [Phycicoccus avicenniae]
MSDEPAAAPAAGTSLPRSRYLPMTTADAVDLAVDGLDDATADDVRAVSDAVGAVVHARYRERWVRARGAAEAGGDALLDDLADLLDRANYDELPREVLDDALGESAVFAVRVEVDLDDFEVLRLWRRGVHRSDQTVRRWWGLRRRTIEFDEYDRVAMYARYRPAEHFTASGRDLDKLAFTPGSEHVKLFQNVPVPDVEMLLPGTRVSMRTVDKIFIGVPAVVGGVVVAVTRLASAVGFLALLAAAYLGLRESAPDISTGVLATLFGAFAALGSFLWRQWSKYEKRRTKYLQSLSEGLYVRTLADGPGVLFTVLDAGEREDVKEAVLAYRGLLDGAAGADAVDERVEGRLHERCGDGVDFEVPDALDRLADLGLATRDEDGVWSALPLEEAPGVLRERWRELGDRLVSGAPADTR